MTTCRHPESALHWHSRDHVFICRRCGEIIFPSPPVAPDDDFFEQDEALCWACGGTGDVDAQPCDHCNGEGYTFENENVRTRS